MEMKNENEDIMRPNFRYCDCCGNCKYSYFSQALCQEVNEAFCIKGFNSFKEALEAKGAITVEETQICDWYEER